MNRFFQKGLLLLSLFNRRRALNAPLYIDLDITERCNLKCKGCRYHSSLLQKSASGMVPPGDMSYDSILRIFNELKSMSTREIILLGAGEPMLHERFTDVVREGKARQFKLTVLTNGTLLNEQVAQDLVDSGLDQIKISMWATSSEDYEKINPGTTPLWFDRIIRGIKYLQKEKNKRGKLTPLIIIHCPVYQNNFQKLEELADKAINCGVDGLTFAPLYGAFDAARHLLLDSQQLFDLFHKLEEVEKKLNQADIQHNIAEMKIRLEFGKAPWETMPCYVGLYHAKIRTDGKVYPCCRCNTVMGDLKENTFREIWNSVTYQSLRNKALNAGKQNPFSDHCNCSHCSFIQNNCRIFQYDRFIAPIARLIT